MYGSTTVQFRRGVPKQTSDHKRYYPPRTNTCRECTCSHRPTSLKEQHSLQEQGRLRAGYETRTESYEILLYCLQQYKGYTIISAYHNLEVEERWIGHVNGFQKTGILSAEFLAVKLLAP